jgi:hypothetical protein
MGASKGSIPWNKGKEMIPFDRRFWARVDKNGPVPAHRPDLGRCWVWLGSRNAKGYGRVFYQGRHQKPHRLSYQEEYGPIPDGLVPDHLCRNRACVNPDHLETVTVRVNLLRGQGVNAINAAKTHCPQGHLYDIPNTYFSKGSRSCKTCHRSKGAS